MNKKIFAFRDDTKSKEADEFIRKNGFTLPFQIFQILSFLIFIVIITFIICISALNTNPIFITFYIFFGILTIAILILSYIVTSINPIDPLSFKYINRIANEEDIKGLYECDICGFVEPQIIQLFGLHIYLISKKMTTYEYIINRSNSEDKEKMGIKTFFEWIIIDKKRLKKTASQSEQDIENPKVEA
ncbi:palmitoyltransferase DHHC3, putative [Plasmodium vinckei brucechwatti]|uniref:Palmitoyltransferase DHHC3, putative n=1 Tax=Plasmodium vinckei brucechwatti TaxID=119398 RepID=A0A6V7S3Y3_PLAVN|nr:palmitoyltransferase DHHC3, putative [Plasmodium vinckei brucechwatti]